jgi:hypothetical protein
VTNRDIEMLLRNTKPPEPKPVLPRTSQELADDGIKLLEQAIGLVEAELPALGELFEGHTLPRALIGAMGLSATELYSKLPALREAAKEAGER